MATQVSTSPKINLRPQLRLALLAAAEACWIYAATLTIGVNANALRVVSPFGIFLVYWIALQTGQLVPRVAGAWRVLQGLTVAIAAFAILVAIRIGLYENAPVTDVTWLPDYLGNTVMFFEHSSAQFISTLALIFAFVRGMSFAQRPLTLWLVGFQFRLGIVVFFGATLFSAITYPVDFITWIFVYFALSLPGIALARIEESGQERPLGGKWALVLFSTVSATMLLGFAAAQFFTLESINALFEFLSPLGFILRIIIAILSVPVILALQLLAKLLTPAFDFLVGMLNNIRPDLNGDNPEVLEFLNQATRVVTDLAPYLRLLGVILVVISIGWLIARALNKRMKWVEEEMFVRETVDDRDGFAPEARKRQRPARFARREIHAENVRRIYAALLAQSENAGLLRREAETPLEFLPRLTERFPYAASALDEITRAYMAVHYAQQPVTDARVRELRQLWQQTQTQMRDAEKKHKS